MAKYRSIRPARDLPPAELPEDATMEESWEWLSQWQDVWSAAMRETPEKPWFTPRQARANRLYGR